jgi:hypothetical protein
MKKFYNPKLKKSANNLLKTICIASVGVICGRLSCHNCHKLLFHLLQYSGKYDFYNLFWQYHCYIGKFHFEDIFKLLFNII